MKRIVSLILILVLAMGVLSGCKEKAKKTSSEAVEQEKYIPVNVENVDARTISEKTTFSGKIIPNKEVMVFPKIPGKVTSLNAEVGKTVSAGSVLFTIEQDDIQKQVDQAKKSVDIAWSNYEKAKEQIDNAKVNFERTKELYEEGAIPKSQYEQAELAASDSTLNTIRIQCEQAELAYNQALNSLKDTTTVASIGGVVSAVNINQGEMASGAQPAVTIVDVSKLYVQIDVPENIISKVAVGQKVDIEVPSSAEKKLTGVIEVVSPTTDPRTQLYQVKVLINTDGKAIKSGMFAKVSLNTYSKVNVTAVKSDAVLEDGGKTYVYLLQDDKAVKRDVKVGFDTGEYIEILEGLKKGETIITKGQQYVENGSKVKVIRGEE